MQSNWGKNINYSIFGESHGSTIGITIHHLPAGVKLNLEFIKKELERRRPGKDKYSTQRIEKDEFEIISGFYNGYTTGAPLTALIKNNDKNSKDYLELKNKMRPSHSDYSAYVKYMGFNDYRGGGHFSGRLTALIVFAGAIAKQLLRKNNITISAEITQVGKIKDVSVNSILTEKMKKEIENAKKENDSVGGSVEVIALNVPTGLGEPFFNSVESILSHLFYSIPAVKAVAFGSGLDIISMRGSEANDEMYYDNNSVKTFTNHNGGVVGGISNSMPIVAKLNFKPTPSIFKKQRTIDVNSKENIINEINGRHDPFVVLRALPVVESMMAIGLLELYMDYKWSEGWCEND